MKTGIFAALEAVGNNQSELARRVAPLTEKGCLTPQAIQRWVDQGYIPVKRVLLVEQAVGIHRSILDPKHYPPEDYEQKQELVA